jgi:hypothetical protein
MHARQARVQTIRHPSSCALLIDSMDRYVTGFPTSPGALISSSAWTLQKQYYVLSGYFNRLALTQVQFFWNLPTIITGYNDQFDIQYNGGTIYNIILPQGWYNANQIGKALVALLNDAIGGAAFTYLITDPPGCIQLTSAAKPFTILVASASATRTGRFYQTAGFIPQDSVALAEDNNVTQTLGIPTLLPTRYIDITSHYLTKFQRVKDASTLSTGDTQNILSRVFAFSGFSDTTWPPVTITLDDKGASVYTYGVPSSFVVVQDYTSPKNIAWSPDEAISNFDILLLDEYGQQVPWTSQIGCEYQITLLASET